MAHTFLVRQKPKSSSSVYLCSETKRKRLLRRLQYFGLMQPNFNNLIRKWRSIATGFLNIRQNKRVLIVWPQATRHDGVPSRGSNIAAGKEWKHLEFILAISKACFFVLSLQKFTSTLLLLCRLFRPLKNTLNRCFRVRDMLVSRHLCVTQCEKNLKFELLYFKNKAPYRAENMQADTFLTSFTGKSLLFFNLHLSSSWYLWKMGAFTYFIFYNIKLLAVLSWANQGHSIKSESGLYPVWENSQSYKRPKCHPTIRKTGLYPAS